LRSLWKTHTTDHATSRVQLWIVGLILVLMTELIGITLFATSQFLAPPNQVSSLNPSSGTMPATEHTGLLGSQASPQSLWVEELRSPELQEWILEGYDTLLIPTGGVEQNGNHLPLGKHNTVVRYTSEQIARQLGHTLIDPIVPFVPEGQIHPPQGHMQWAGTISLTPTTFESLLTEIILSAQQHGFRYVCILGEHGESQDIQLKVANKLNQESIPFHRYVLHVDAYYQDAEQRAWLRSLGETDKSIGHHAGLMDTSEFMAVNAQLLRSGVGGQGAYQPSQGSDGDPRHASVEWGQYLLQLKIQHAVNQIRSWKSVLDQARHLNGEQKA